MRLPQCAGSYVVINTTRKMILLRSVEVPIFFESPIHSKYSSHWKLGGLTQLSWAV